MKKLTIPYFYPTAKEVEAAMSIFESQLAWRREGNSERCAIKCALADVWVAARLYEYEREREAKRRYGTETGGNLPAPSPTVIERS